jgi:hypothetical protein
MIHVLGSPQAAGYRMVYAEQECALIMCQIEERAVQILDSPFSYYNITKYISRPLAGHAMQSGPGSRDGDLNRSVLPVGIWHI